MSIDTSTMSTSDAASLVASEYGFGAPDACRLMQAQRNDTYAVEIAGQRFALRIYELRDKWWIAGESDLRFELDLLNHLHGENIPVSFPLPRRNGDVLGRFGASGRVRYFSLFSWAPGDPGSKTLEKARLLGRTLAMIHVAADRYQTTHRRYALDERTLLDRFVGEMEPSLRDDEPANVQFIREQIATIRRCVRAFDPGPGGWGIIHGDVQELNVHFTSDEHITVFDFDLCGYGWRAYDISYYYTRIREHLRMPFLDGYESVRPLNDAEHDMLPTLGRLAWIREGVKSKGLVKRLNDPYMSFQ